MLSKSFTLCCMFLAGSTRPVSPDPQGPPELVRRFVFHRTGAGGDPYFSVLLSTPSEPELATSYVRMRIVRGRRKSPTYTPQDAKGIILDLLVRRAGRQLLYVPQLVSLTANGRIPCEAVESPFLDLSDTLGTIRRVPYQTCHFHLKSALLAWTIDPSNADTLYRYRVATPASSTHLPQLVGVEVDQHLGLRGLTYWTMRGHQDKWLTYRGQAPLAPASP